MKTTLAILSLAITSCGISGTVNIPLPDKLGGGSIPIVINAEK